MLCAYETQMNFMLDLSPIPKISHYVYANITKSEAFWTQEIWIRNAQCVIQENISRLRDGMLGISVLTYH